MATSATRRRGRGVRWIAAAAASAAGLLAFGPPAASDTPRRPDLVVGSLVEPPHQARPGDRFTVWDVTANRGRRRAAASETRFALGPHGPLAVRSVPALRKRAQSRGEVVIAIPAGMPDGEYALIACADAADRVRERDERNNCTSSAGVVVIDTAPPPAPSLDERPAPVALGGDARFAFSSTEAGVQFACALDGAPLVSCTSPVEVDGLDDGEHRFRVVARDAAGNESAPAEVSWTVVPRQTTLGDGAWSWFADPRAVHHGGRHRRTYVGWVAGDGDVKVSAYDHDTLARTTALVAPAVEVDDHANPAVQILPDGRVRAYYSAHGGARMWYRTSLAAEDVSAWGPVVTLPENAPGSRGFTYPNPVHLAAEGWTRL